MAESQQQRGTLDRKLKSLYASRNELTGIKRLKVQQSIDRLEQTLSWQGANPKQLDVIDLRNHIRQAPQADALEAKYQGRIKNRATGIRAYCVQCQGGDTSGVRSCPSITCPLHPFRMGTDPLRGFDIPKAAPIEVPDEDGEDAALFEEGDDNDADATE
jgi:hypothetical protein